MSNSSDDDPPDFSPKSWRGPAPDADYLGPRGLPVQDSEELTRILNLPRRPPVVPGSATSEALIEIAQAKYSRGPRACRCAELSRDIAEGKRKCVTRFLPVQAWMLHEISVANGLLANVFVGGGKTIVSLTAILALKDCPLALLLIPASLVDQIVEDYRLLAEHFRVPSLVVHLSGKKTWKSEPKRAPNGTLEPTLHVLPYSKLSGIKNSGWMENLRPSAVICDEVDALKDLSAARTMRLMRLFEQYPDTRFCGWTGSLTDSSVSEFAHLACLALRECSPLPVKREVIDEWSRCLDAVPSPCPPGALIRLLEPGESSADIRKAFRRRLAETQGFIAVEGRQVILTSSGEEVMLDVRERHVNLVPPKIAEALDKVRDFLRPDTMGGSQEDEILVDPLEQAACVRQVATGLFYRFIFPRGEPKALITEWYAARKFYNSELRQKMLKGEVNLDSPKLCEHAAMRAWGDAALDPMLPDWRAENWPRWRDVKDLVRPEQEAVRLDSFLVEDAAEWAANNTGIIWYGMVEFAEWLRELTGLPMFGGGMGKELVAQRGDRSVIASIKSHGRGRNGLQFSFDNQLVVNTMASARGYQQLWGRLKRRGQESALVRSEVYIHTPELRATFEQALRRGEYVQETMGESQMLIEAWSGSE